MSEHKNEAPKQEKQYSLNDDRRVKVLSPGALVARRFFRNRLAVIGLSILIAMFLFSFLGGWISPYGEDELFYTETYQNKEYVGITENTEYRYLKLTDEYSTLLQAKTVLAIGQGGGTIENDGKSYDVVQEGDGLFSVYSGTTVIGAAYLDIVSAEDSSVRNHHHLRGTDLYGGQRWTDSAERPICGGGQPLCGPV